MGQESDKVVKDALGMVMVKVERSRVHHEDYPREKEYVHVPSHTLLIILLV